MDFVSTLRNRDFILTEAAVIESLKRSGSVRLHRDLENAPLIYEAAGRQALKQLYGDFLDAAAGADVPITLCTPTWRANRERVAAAGMETDINGDAVAFLKRICGDAHRKPAGGVFVGGLIGCKSDCYLPGEGLAWKAAERFHAWQVERLAGADFLLAATLPCLTEARGIARAMAASGLPYIISFVIDRRGNLLDGTRLADALASIDQHCVRPPIGYMINCAHPAFLNAPQQPAAVFERLVGFQGNASSLDHAELDGSAELMVDDIDEWSRQMVILNRRYGVKILGGCCGTSRAHLDAIIARMGVGSAEG